MKKISRNEDVSALIRNIEDVKKEISVVKSNFNMETDECLIDCYIYQMEALNKKYQYFIRKAKQIGIKGDDKCCSRLL